MKEGINRVRAKNFKKASDLRSKGFKTAIHALPAKVRETMDTLLKDGISPKETLKLTSAKYPKIQLPSYVAVDNYRKKYLGINKTETPKDIELAEKQLVFSKKKLEIEQGLSDTIHTLTFSVIPKMVKTLETSVLNEEKIKLPMGTNDKRLDIVVKAIAVFNQWAERNGIKLYQSETTTEVLEGGEEEGKEVDWDDVLADTINRSRTQIKIRQIQKIAVTQR